MSDILNPSGKERAVLIEEDALCEALKMQSPPFTDETYTGDAREIVRAVLDYEGENAIAAGIVAFLYSERKSEPFKLEPVFLEREGNTLNHLVEMSFLEKTNGNYRVTECGGKVCEIYKQYVAKYGMDFDFRRFNERNIKPYDLTKVII